MPLNIQAKPESLAKVVESYAYPMDFTEEFGLITNLMTLSNCMSVLRPIRLQNDVEELLVVTQKAVTVCWSMTPHTHRPNVLCSLLANV